MYHIINIWIKNEGVKQRLRGEYFHSCSCHDFSACFYLCINIDLLKFNYLFDIHSFGTECHCSRKVTRIIPQDTYLIAV